MNASVLYRPGHSDHHVYPYWTPIMQQRTWHPNGGPWRWHEGEVRYTPDACPRTLDLLSRAVRIDISPDLSNENIEELAEGLNKVLSVKC
ncbi:MAG: hypothetical protein ACUVR3_05845 [Candidatus Roseilinea sp.]|uniref:hypothetical protein n=1 Tax=Candidatus Roseilinea sp. TaxID=2838777 RepID=UPI00404A9AD3